MEIIANHAHLQPDPAQSKNPWWPVGDTDTRLDHLDSNGIDMAVVFPPFACQFDNDMKGANLWALKETRQYHDRLHPGRNIEPNCTECGGGGERGYHRTCNDLMHNCWV